MKKKYIKVLAPFGPDVFEIKIRQLKPLTEGITITFTRSELAALSIATAVLADRTKQIWENGEGSINTREQDDGVVADAELANDKIMKALEEWIGKRIK